MENLQEEVIANNNQLKIDDVQRVIELGRILLLALTQEEIEEIQILLSSKNQIGNTGDS